MFSGIKDSLASTAVKSLLASRMERYGKIKNLQINSREKTIESELELLGEEHPVCIQIGRYRITEKAGKPGKYVLVVERVTASRPWLQNLLQDNLVEKAIPVPSTILLALGKSES